MAHRLSVGIYGGTFDPPHIAHLNLARFALDRLRLDRLYIVPARGHALKQNDSITPAAVRLEMVRAAFRNEKKIRVSKIELEGPETSFTVETVARFAAYEGLNDPELFYLVGADILHEIHLWKEPSRLFAMAKIVVLHRPGFDHVPDRFRHGENVQFLDSPPMPVSSTDIRRRIRNGQPVSGLIPPEVLDLINEHGLYR